jgi:deoxycytidine triphosphate deaminase
MHLTIKEALANGVIENPQAQTEDMLARYNLTINKILVAGQEYDEYTVKPQEMFTIISNERLNMQRKYIGYVLNNFQFGLKGFMTLNTGIIDPEWHGYISTTAINFRKEAYTLKKNEFFMSMVFHKIESNSADFESKKVDLDEYIQKRKVNTAAYPETFMDVDSLMKDKVREEVIRLIKNWGLTLLSLFLGVVGLYWSVLQIAK